MPETHVVVQGEDMFTIAARYGFRDYRTIYEDAANSALRRARPNPGVLYPGDRVTIPDPEQRVEERPTGQRHTFRTVGARRLLCLRLLGPFGKPCADMPYTLEIDGHALPEGRRTDAEGRLSEAIPLHARSGKVTVGDLFWHLAIGELDPMLAAADDGVSGAQARLRNLGYDPGPADGKLGPRTATAIRRFQEERGLPVTGELDAATKGALARDHGC